MAEDGSERTVWEAGILFRVGDMVYDARRKEWLLWVDPDCCRPVSSPPRYGMGGTALIENRTDADVDLGLTFDYGVSGLGADLPSHIEYPEVTLTGKIIIVDSGRPRWYRGLWHRLVGVLRRWRHG